MWLCLVRPLAAIRLTALHTSRRSPVRRWISTCSPLQTVSDQTSTTNVFNAIYPALEAIEPFERYTAGGYYPVRIGDWYCSSRYYIIHKLGYGASSTTWLARDERLSKYVAIKFAVSDLDHPFESTVSRTLWNGEKSNATEHVGIAIIPKILDEFDVEGQEIHGVRRKHQCLATTPARMNISEAREASYNRLYQPLVARAIATQLIQAIAFLHSRSIIHVGGSNGAGIILTSVDHLKRPSRGQYPASTA